MRGPHTKVRNVNTAFGTKYFFFADYDESGESNKQPLISDRCVVSALHKTPADTSAVFRGPR